MIASVTRIRSGESGPGRAVPGTTRRRSDEAYDAIYRAIVRCEVAPGEIVTELQLGERFGFGRAAVRAALDRLSERRLLRPMRRQGYCVKPITLRDVNELFELRMILELGAIRLAAGRVDEASLRHLDSICSQGYKPGDRESEARFLAANSEFHLVIATATGNERLVSFLAQTLSEMERLFHFGLAARNRTDEMRSEHKALMEALIAGDAERAEAVTREQIVTSKAMVMDALLTSSTLLDASISPAHRSAWTE